MKKKGYYVKFLSTGAKPISSDTARALGIPRDWKWGQPTKPAQDKKRNWKPKKSKKIKLTRHVVCPICGLVVHKDDIVLHLGSELESRNFALPQLKGVRETDETITIEAPFAVVGVHSGKDRCLACGRRAVGLEGLLKCLDDHCRFGEFQPKAKYLLEEFLFHSGKQPQIISRPSPSQPIQSHQP